MQTVPTTTVYPYDKIHPLQAHVRALGLTRPPFPVTPDDESAYFFSDRLNEMYEELKHFIQLRKGFMLVTGDVGVGKTTLTRLLLSHLGQKRVRTALIINTFLQDLELFRAINRDFELSPREDTLEGHLQCLNNFLMKAYDANYNCVLIIDDAQRLSTDSLELIRQLSNLETTHDKLLQIILVAQPEIMDTLNRFDLRQLRSRIALHVRLQPLTLREADQYLHHRLFLAGNSKSGIKVTPGALRKLHHATEGYPRLIHMVMDRCLFGLVARKTLLIDHRLMQQAIDESSLSETGLRQKRTMNWTWPSGIALAVLVFLAAGLIDTESLSHPAPQVTSSGSIATATKVAPPETSVNSARWQEFLDAYPGLQGTSSIHEPLDDSQTQLDKLTAHLAPYDWIPVRLDPALIRTCNGLPVTTIGTGTAQPSGIALFRTRLPVAPVPFSHGSDSVREMQSKLVSLGLLDVNGVDGIMGGQTASALARFQKSSNLSSTGQPDAQTSYALECSMSQRRMN